TMLVLSLHACGVLSINQLRFSLVLGKKK
ncbi:hypothetical protein A2U01_0036870, partial [Trifolium medium]|nr:hypothetical protein [Trifolium medium]